MHRLQVAPEQHFADADYAGSEVLIYRWDPAAAQVLVCCLDLSEKIAGWAYGAGSPAYAARYRILRFRAVDDYRRTGVAGAWSGAQDDFVITRDDRRLPIDDISVAAADHAHAVALSFERGFGATNFRCREIVISELTTQAAPGPDGSSRYVDADDGAVVDEDAFLSGLYGSVP